MFARLVKSLLNVEVIGIHYPGHIATAVLLRNPVGTSYDYNGKSYSVADPTYVNAPVGLVMTQDKNVKPKIIAIH